MHQFKSLQKRKCCRDYRNKLQRQITNCNYFHQNVFSVIFTIWIIFYYCYSNPKIDFECQVIKTIFTQERNTYSKSVKETLEQSVKLTLQ